MGRVSVLDANTGSVVSTIRVGESPSAVAVGAHSRRVFVGNGGSNTVSVLDARSGSLLRTVPMDGGPGAMAVDEANGHAVVANEDNAGLSVLDGRGGRVLTRIGAVTLPATSSRKSSKIDWLSCGPGPPSGWNWTLRTGRVS